ncbi:MAG: hypothetical protein HOO86_16995 [Bacteroidales bacterium]|nr:hypothetical protein [Bacteroidales bacterium]
MKTKVSLLVSLLILSLCCIADKGEDLTSKTSQKESIRILCSPEMYKLTSRWTSAYASQESGQQIELVINNDNLINTEEAGLLRFISSNDLYDHDFEKHWQIVVGREIIVPIINSKNPNLDLLLKHGITTEQFAQIFNSSEAQTWESFLPEGKSAPIHLYMVNDETVKIGVSRFVNEINISRKQIKSGDHMEIISAIQNDPNAIGFCKIADIMDARNQSLIDNISLLPIDKNGNRMIDAVENIYSDVPAFMRGVWIGKFPRTLVNKIYAASDARPAVDAEAAFLKWVLIDGQQILNSTGYSLLENSELQSQLDKLTPVNIKLTPQNTFLSPSVIFLITFALLLAFSIFLTAVIRGFRNRTSDSITENELNSIGFDEKKLAIPMGLYFDKTHIWAFMEKDGKVTVGMDDFLQHITGPITRIMLKNQGEQVKKGDILFTIMQQGKHLHLYAPVSGTIKQINESLINHAGYLNTSPFSEGWVYKLEPAGWLKDIQLLIVAGTYKNWISHEMTRVKDFLTMTLKPESLEYAHVVLQDGGTLKDNVLAEFGPEVWEDFQTKFLDIYK